MPDIGTCDNSDMIRGTAAITSNDNDPSPPVVSSIMFLRHLQATTGDDNDDNGDPYEPNALHVFVMAMIVLVALFVGVTCLGVVIYYVAWLSDHWCCCGPFSARRMQPTIIIRQPRDDNENHEEDNNTDNATPPVLTVTQKARLQGITEEERFLILQHLFRQTVLYQDVLVKQQQQQQQTNNTTTTKSSPSNETAFTTHTNKDLPQNSSNNKCTPQQPSLKEQTNSSSSSSSSIDEPAHASSGSISPQEQNVQSSCAICLTPYKPHDNVICGHYCGHVFHRACILPWMMQKTRTTTVARHVVVTADECPYCRQDFVSAVDYRHAALDILGSPRVGAAGVVASDPLRSFHFNDNDQDAPTEGEEDRDATAQRAPPRGGATRPQQQEEEIPDWDIR